MTTRTHQKFVKTYLVDRGFGFAKITSHQNALDVFFHISKLERAESNKSPWAISWRSISFRMQSPAATRRRISALPTMWEQHDVWTF